MNYQDQIIKNLVDSLESAIKKNLSNPCIFNAQKVAEAKHEISKFMKGA